MQTGDSLDIYWTALQGTTKNMSDNSFECLAEIAKELKSYDVDEKAVQRHGVILDIGDMILFDANSQ